MSCFIVLYSKQLSTLVLGQIQLLVVIYASIHKYELGMMLEKGIFCVV